MWHQCLHSFAFSQPLPSRWFFVLDKQKIILIHYWATSHCCLLTYRSCCIISHKFVFLMWGGIIVVTCAINCEWLSYALFLPTRQMPHIKLFLVMLRCVVCYWKYYCSVIMEVVINCHYNSVSLLVCEVSLLLMCFFSGHVSVLAALLCFVWCFYVTASLP
jgi:hypothetical protein